MAGQILFLSESCLNRSVLIRVVRSNLPQTERKSMALVSSYDIMSYGWLPGSWILASSARDLQSSDSYCLIARLSGYAVMKSCC